MKCHYTFEYFEFLEQMLINSVETPNLLFRTLAKCAKTYFLKIKTNYENFEVLKTVEEADQTYKDEKFLKHHQKFFSFLDLLLIESGSIIVKEVEIQKMFKAFIRDWITDETKSMFLQAMIKWDQDSGHFQTTSKILLYSFNAIVSKNLIKEFDIESLCVFKELFIEFNRFNK